MRYLLLLLILGIYIPNSKSQIQKKIWDKTFGGLSTDIGSFINHHKNGNIYVFGSFSNSSPDPKDMSNCYQYGEKDFIAICYDSTGKKIWNISFGGQNEDGVINKVIPTDDGFELFLLTKSNNTGVIDKNPCNVTGMIQFYKIDLNGKIAYSNAFCIDNTFIQGICDIQKFTDGNYRFLLYTSEFISDPPILGIFTVTSSMGIISQYQFPAEYSISPTNSTNKICEEANGGFSILLTYDYNDSGCSGSQNGIQCCKFMSLTIDYKVLKQKVFYSSKSDTYSAGLLKYNNEYYLAMMSTPYVVYNKDIIGACNKDNKYLRNLVSSPARNSTDKDIWLVNTSTTLQVLKEASYGVEGYLDLTSFSFKSDSTLIIGCLTNGGGTFDKKSLSKGGHDYWSINLNNTLGLISEYSYGGSSSDQLSNVNSDWQGTYYVGTTKSNNGGDKSDISRGDWDIWTVVTCVQPIASFSVAPKDTSIIAGSLVKFNNNSTSCNRYKWDFGDGSYSYSKDPVHYFNGIGKYHVKLWVANAFCNDSLIKTNLINVVKYVGIEQHEAESMINVYPNPFAGMVNIDIQNVFETISIDVYSTIGQGILHETGFHGGQIDLTNQPNGMYYLTITGEKFSLTKKIFKNE